MRRGWLGVFAVVVAAGLIGIAAAVISRDGGSSPSPPTPGQVRLSQQSGDDADLMRRLQRKKLVQGTK